jgi:hypothetical protein
MRGQRRAALVVVVLLVLVTGVGAGQSAIGDAPDLEQLVRAAMSRDEALQQRQLEVRNRELALARKAALKGFGLALNFGGPETNREFLTLADGVDIRYGINSSLVASLPHPFGSISTTATVTGPVDEPEASPGFWRCSEQPGAGFRDCVQVPGEPAAEEPWELPPYVSLGLATRIEQPLGSLLGLDASPGDDLEATHAVVQAQRAVRLRVRAITRDLLQRMTAILQRRIAARRSLHAIAELEDEVVRRRDVFQDNEQSHRFQTLLFNLELERRALETTRLLLQQEHAAFEERTGATEFGPLGQANLRLPPAEQAGRAPEVVDATVDLRVSEHRIREDDNSRWPEVTLNAGYDWRENKLSAGVGFDFTLPLVDGGLQRLKAEELSNARRAAELAGTAARRAFADALIQAERDVRDLEYRAWEQRERTRLAALKVVETKAALEAGVITPAELAQAELDHELLALEGEILRADRWKLKLDLAALTDADPLDFAGSP